MPHKILIPKIDEGLYARLKAAAQAEHRTVSNYVYVLLTRTFPEPAKEEKP